MNRNEEDVPFGTTRFVRRGRWWHHLDAKGTQIGQPYSWIWVCEKPLVAEVEEPWSGSNWLIDVCGVKIGDAFLKGHRKKHEDGPGGIVWAGPLDKDDRGGTAILPDGKVLGEFSEIAHRAYGEVRWVRRLGSTFEMGHWRLLNAAGELIGPPGITEAYDFSDGLALIQTADQFLFLTPAGEQAWSGTCLEALDFYAQRAWVRMSEGWMLVDTGGRRIGNGVYDDLDDRLRHPFSIAMKGENWYIVRRADGICTPDEGFDWISLHGRHHPNNMRFEVRRGARSEIIDVVTGQRWLHGEAERVGQVQAWTGGGDWDD